MSQALQVIITDICCVGLCQALLEACQGIVSAAGSRGSSSPSYRAVSRKRRSSFFLEPADICFQSQPPSWKSCLPLVHFHLPSNRQVYSDLHMQVCARACTHTHVHACRHTFSFSLPFLSFLFSFSQTLDTLSLQPCSLSHNLVKQAFAPLTNTPESMHCFFPRVLERARTQTDLGSRLGSTT